MGDGKKNLHRGHRERVRSRFLAEGLDAFEDHQVLEFLLFFAIPQHDTNETAHLLLKRYGSLSAVLDADPIDLAQTPGVGKVAATLLSLVPSLTRRYETDRARQERCHLTTVERAADRADTAGARQSIAVRVIRRRTGRHGDAEGRERSESESGAAGGGLRSDVHGR